MTHDAVPAGQAPPLCLPPLLDLARADALLESLQSRVVQDTALRVDGSAVEVVSTACLQVLVAAAASTRARGQSFTLCGASPVLRDAVRDLGLHATLAMGDA